MPESFQVRIKELQLCKLTLDIKIAKLKAEKALAELEEMLSKEEGEQKEEDGKAKRCYR